jgi:hypothetical protein
MVILESISEREARKLKLEKNLNKNRVVLNRSAAQKKKIQKQGIPCIEFD